MLSMQRWMVICTRPRWEKKVALALLAKGIETFCPLVSERRKWSDRIKIIGKPLLKNYLLVRIQKEQRTEVRLTEGVVNFLYQNGKPVAIKEKMVQQIRQFQQAHSFIYVTDTTAVMHNGKPSKSNVKQATLDIKILNIVLVAGTPQPDPVLQ